MSLLQVRQVQYIHSLPFCAASPPHQRIPKRSDNLAT